MDDEAYLQRGKNKEYWVGATANTPKTTIFLTDTNQRTFLRNDKDSALRGRGALFFMLVLGRAVVGTGALDGPIKRATEVRPYGVQYEEIVGAIQESPAGHS